MNTPRTEQNRIPNSELSDWGVGLSNYVDLECSRNLELELNEAKAENKRLTELLDASTVHSCGDHCQRPTCKRAMRNAIKDAHWQLFAFLKPGDEKTKAIIERLQKFL